MISRFKLLVSYAIFWLCFFQVSRVLFLCYHYRLTKSLPFYDWFLIMLHGIKMDLSATGYVLMLPSLLMVFSAKSFNIFLSNFLKYYTATLLFIFSLLVIADLELYRHWGFRMDDTPLLYLRNPKEVMGSSDPWMTVLLIIFWLLFFAGSYWLLIKSVLSRYQVPNQVDIQRSVYFFVLTLILIFPIRGSLGRSNMNTGFVYFHDSNVFANHAAVNVVWNFQYYLFKSGRSNYPDNFFDKPATQKHFVTLYSGRKAGQRILTNKRPNIILLALESYTSKIVGVLGGAEGVSPNLDALSKEGVLFTNLYSSGDRTEDGMVSILSGYPAQPRTSIMKYPQKTENLPFISEELKSAGYHTSFIFGYDIDYANFRSYLVNANFDGLQSQADFEIRDRNSKWGVHDHIVLNRILDHLNGKPSPFFLCSMTLSSHEPFDVPMDPVFSGNETQRFFNSAYYTDKCIGEFIAAAKSQDWWENTLIILVADHGSRLPNKDPAYAKSKYSIPMLWLGGALAVRDTVINTLGSQTDIATTLLNQLDLNSNNFEFSKDLLSKQTKPFAFYCYTNGFGFVGADYELTYDHDAGRYITQTGKVDPIGKEQGRAYMQKVFWDFNNR